MAANQGDNNARNVDAHEGDLSVPSRGAAATQVVGETSGIPPPEVTTTESDWVEDPLYACPLCRLEFPSYRSLCGHMNAHRNRTWRGVHPPPGVRLQDYIEYDVEAAESGGRMLPGVAAEEAEPAATENVRGPNIMLPGGRRPLLPDLNELPPEEEGEDRGVVR